MQEDTAKNIIRVNVHMISALIGICLAFITGVAWGVRLEDKTDQNEKLAQGNAVRIVLLEKTSNELDRRFAVFENDLHHIKEGIDELKGKP